MFIEGKEIYKSFNVADKKYYVLKGVNININYGEFVAIMGSSGSGKSTLLYILGLLDDLDSGSIYINKEEVSKLNSKKKTEIRLKYLGYVFQDFYLIPEFKLYENVALAAIADGVKKEKAYEKAKKVLSLVGLKEHINKKPTRLSGGQQQRVAIARALINDPVILFADEPTANLDSKTSLEIINLFRYLNKNYNLTIVMVTHEDEFKKYVDRTIFLKDGKII